MKALILQVIILIVSFAYLGHLKIGFSPFSIALPYWYRSVAVLLMGIAIILYGYGEVAISRKQIIQEFMEYFKPDKDLSEKDSSITE